MDMSRYDLIRPDIIESLNAYAEHGRPTGHFLGAVLSNDLFGAVGKADSDNIETLALICSYIYNKLPAICWGSRDKVLGWLKQKREEREPARS